MRWYFCQFWWKSSQERFLYHDCDLYCSISLALEHSSCPRSKNACIKSLYEGHLPTGFGKSLWTFNVLGLVKFGACSAILNNYCVWSQQGWLVLGWEVWSLRAPYPIMKHFVHVQYCSQAYWSEYSVLYNMHNSPCKWAWWEIWCNIVYWTCMCSSSVSFDNNLKLIWMWCPRIIVDGLLALQVSYNRQVDKTLCTG